MSLNDAPDLRVIESIVLSVLSFIGAFTCGWLALTLLCSAIASICAKLDHLSASQYLLLVLKRWGTPGVKRIVVSTLALTLMGSTNPAFAEDLGQLPDDLSWGYSTPLAKVIEPQDVTLSPQPPTPTPKTQATPSPQFQASDSHTVKPGESLWSIAAAHLPEELRNDSTVAKEWPKWYAENQELIGSNPHMIYPGQKLRTPNRM
ncbi:MAG: LysM peptidoglycan-binding domain-containing protein [Actinomycetaceae bacterium]|nr:LysM peptidoglycan-binding domain-containing protein [Actinomycetaceae bacterium]